MNDLLQELVELHNRNQKVQDHFIEFESFYRPRFFTSLDQILSLLADPGTSQFDTIFHTVQAYPLKFIQMVLFV